MLTIPEILRIGNRSGEELTTEDLRLARETLESSAVIREYEHDHRPRTGKATYGIMDKLMIMLYVEVRKTTYGGAIAEFGDLGGQDRLRALGFPLRGGERLCPCKSTMSDFVNKIWPRISAPLMAEMTEAILRSQGDRRFYTCDSTPLEASRYSKRSEYSPHYEIRMDKCHMIMVNGYPIAYTRTGGNDGDNPQLRVMLERMDGVPPSVCSGFATDGAYHSFETYADVYMKTGKVMATNQGSDAVFHPEATWQKVLARYQRFWRRADYVLPKHATPDRIIRYMISHGESDLAGRFLHNLDFRRGRALKSEMSRRRHVCETAHFDAKRWMRFDVRGLSERNVDSRIGLRVFFCQLLSTIFRGVSRTGNRGRQSARILC